MSGIGHILMLWARGLSGMVALGGSACRSASFLGLELLALASSSLECRVQPRKIDSCLWSQRAVGELTHFSQH